MIDALNKKKENVEEALVVLNNLFDRFEVTKAGDRKLAGIITKNEYNALRLARNFMLEELALEIML